MICWGAEEVTEVAQSRVAARDADLAARDADLAARAADLETTRMLLTAALSANQELGAELEQMKVALAKLQEQVARSSSNSNSPRSSDSPGTNAKPGRSKGKRRRGGQRRGHKGSHRQLSPAEQTDEFIDLYPPCRTS